MSQNVAGNPELVTVKIRQGELCGQKEPDWNGRLYCSFKGIPYAKPPINELKFKAPLPHEGWTGVREAFNEGNDCYHLDKIHNREGGSDDCLYINVYSPSVEQLMKQPKEPTKKQQPKVYSSTYRYPVMVWIHGAGMFKCGSSHSDYYGPKYLMAQKIVLVTFNYRLGIRGFLSLEDGTLGVPGNAGLKDMVMALQWVQENIKKFGGNPNNVTIAGQGAGAAAVDLLMLSKLAKGLFHKAIAQSGSALCPWVWSENGGYQKKGKATATQKLCDKLNIPRENEQRLLEELQAKTNSELFELEESIPEVAEMATFRSFSPIIEKNSPGAFLHEEPIDIILRGEYNHVPLIMGFNSLDGLIIDRWLLDNITVEETRNRLLKGDAYLENDRWLRDQWRMLVPRTIHEFLNSTPYVNVETLGRYIMSCYGVQKVRRHYYSLYTDNMFARDIIFSAEFHAKTSDPFKCPVYLYEMSIETNLNVMKRKSGFPYPGTCYEDDIFYLFSTRETQPERNSPEAEAIGLITKMWATFMSTGDPNSGVTDRSWYWTPISQTEVTHLEIMGDRSKGIQLETKFKPELKKMQLWRIIFELDRRYARLFAEGLETVNKHESSRDDDGDDNNEDESVEDIEDGKVRFEKMLEKICIHFPDLNRKYLDSPQMNRK